MCACSGRQLCSSARANKSNLVQKQPIVADKEIAAEGQYILQNRFLVSLIYEAAISRLSLKVKE